MSAKNEGPRVEPTHINKMFASLSYQYARVGSTTVTGCWAFLPNGFSVGYGESSCVDPANFQATTGQHEARKRCEQASRDKLWELEGYLLKTTGKVSEL